MKFMIDEKDIDKKIEYKWQKFIEICQSRKILNMYAICSKRVH